MTDAPLDKITFGIRLFLISLVVMACLVVVYERKTLHPYLIQNPNVKSGLAHSQSTTNHTICVGKRHIGFLKVPKAGSSTVQNILYRFGAIRGLTFVLPTFTNYIGRNEEIHDDAIIPPPANKHYDILCNHVRFKRSEFARLLPSDTAYVGIVREPLPHLESCIYYYHSMSILGDDKLTEYLEDPERYIEKGIRPNPQTHYYGLQDYEAKHKPSVKQFIKRTLSDFSVIIVLERFDESLLLMKRKFCWNLTDILYIRKNTNFGNPRKASSHPRRSKHKSLALAEYIFYDKCQLKLIKEIMKEGEDFQHELDFYRQTLRGVSHFCSDRRQRWDDQFYIEASKWGPETNVSIAACYLMGLPELEFQDFVGHKQYGSDWDRLHTAGPLWYKKRVKETQINGTLQNGQPVERRSFRFDKRN